MAIGAILATLAGSLIGGAASAKGARRANEEARAEAARNRAFQERMSSTSHQREVEDLRAAGLNPILSAQKGASSPGGSMAQIRDELTPAVNSALMARRLTQEIRNLKATEVNTMAQTATEFERASSLGVPSVIGDAARDARSQYDSVYRGFAKGVNSLRVGTARAWERAKEAFKVRPQPSRADLKKDFRRRSPLRINIDRDTIRRNR